VRSVLTKGGNPEPGASHRWGAHYEGELKGGGAKKRNESLIGRYGVTELSKIGKKERKSWSQKVKKPRLLGSRTPNGITTETIVVRRG